MAKAFSVSTTEETAVIFTYTVTQTGTSNSLNGDIAIDATTITLADASSFSASGKIRIEEEIIIYTGKSGNDLTGCTRGAEESTAATHADTTAVYEVTTAWSSNLKSTAVFDYFADNADIGSAIYFAKKIYYDPGMNGLKFNVGTAIAATSYTLKVEAWDNRGTGHWSELPDVTDNTNSFSTTGENWMYFRIPQWWAHKTLTNGGLSTWMRIRLTAVSGLTEGGANQTESVRVRKNQIDCTGGTDADPVTMDDIYQADVAGGWGMVELTHNSSSDWSSYFKFYTLKGIFVNLSSGCVFKDLTNPIIMGLPGYFIGSEGGAVMQLGEQVIAKRVGRYGGVYVPGAFGYNSNLYWSGVHHKFYNSAVIVNANQTLNYSGDWDMVGGHIMRAGAGYIHYGGGDVNWHAVGSNVLANSYTAPSDPNWDFTNSDFDGLIAYGGGDVGARWATARDAYFGTIWYRSGSGYNPTVLVFYDVTYASLSNNYGTSSDAYVYVHYSLTATVKDSAGNLLEGVTVSIKDQEGNTPQCWVGGISGGLVDVSDLTTDVNGVIGPQDVLHFLRHHDYDPDPDVVTNTTYSPFTVQLSKAGYITQTHKITMDEKKDLVFTLEKVNKWITDGDDVLWNLDKTNAHNKLKWSKVNG